MQRVWKMKWKKTMKEVLAVVWLTVAACGAALAAQSQPQAQPQRAATSNGSIVVIDGKAHPEELPDHWVWRATFHHFALAKKMGKAKPWEQIGLAPPDIAALLAESAAQETRDLACEKQIGERQAELHAQGAKADALQQAFRDVTIECRTRDLEARDRLLQAVSPEGRDRLVQWVMDSRSKMTAYVPAADLDYFKRPQ